MEAFSLEPQTPLHPDYSGLKVAVRQGFLHLALVYAVTLLTFPWMLDIFYRILTALSGPNSRVNPFQFVFSHLLVFSLALGISAGFGATRFFDNRVVLLIWLVPAMFLAYCFFFRAPGMYPTMILDSDFRQAFHYYFGKGFHFTNELDSQREIGRYFLRNAPDFLRGVAQLRVTVPAYVGIAYSAGAWLSFRWRATSPGSFSTPGANQ